MKKVLTGTTKKRQYIYKPTIIMALKDAFGNERLANRHFVSDIYTERIYFDRKKDEMCVPQHKRMIFYV